MNLECAATIVLILSKAQEGHATQNTWERQNIFGPLCQPHIGSILLLPPEVILVAANESFMNMRAAGGCTTGTILPGASLPLSFSCFLSVTDQVLFRACLSLVVFGLSHNSLALPNFSSSMGRTAK